MLPGASPWKQTHLERYVPMPLDESLLLPNKAENNNIQTTFYHKPTDQQAFLHAKSEHPRSLKRSISYSQALKLKTVCSTSTEFDKNCAIFLKST